MSQALNQLNTTGQDRLYYIVNSIISGLKTWPAPGD